MEKNGSYKKTWKFNNLEKEVKTGDEQKPLTVAGATAMLKANVNPNDERPLIALGHGDPAPFHCFRVSAIAEGAVVDALRSASFNGYPKGAFGYPPARKAIAEYISKDLPYELSANDVFITGGCKQSLQAAIFASSTPDSNILLPRPTFPLYDAAAAFSGLQCRHYDLLPEKEWEVDIDSVEALADSNTVAIVLINPGNPTGSVYTREHLQKVAETASKLGLLVIADEVYEHITFGCNPFVRMAVFASLVPVLTLGSLSKRWVVPGWRFGWLVTTDPNDILQNSQFLDRVKSFLMACSTAPTFVQAAVPEIIEKTEEEFFTKCIDVMRQDADIVFEKLEEISCITCPTKPEGSMFIMVKLNVSMLDGINNDIDFCLKLANQENVIVLPGTTIGMENWLRVTFALEPSVLEEGLRRVKDFCQRNAKLQ